jgi:hypothetical protein
MEVWWLLTYVMVDRLLELQEVSRSQFIFEAAADRCGGSQRVYL